MIVHIPMHIVEDAVRDMQKDLSVEVIGFFCMDKDFKIAWHLAENIYPEPEVGAEIDAKWLAQKIINEQLTPIAMAHSHPSGLGYPSDGDYVMFPTMYVNVAFIWYAGDPIYLTQYTANRELHIVGVEAVFVVVDA